MQRKLCALFSVFDKTGVVEDATRLVAMGWDIISSGGTAKVLAGSGIPVKDVAELVGGGAILGHRVVTLSREVHAGLLADTSKPEDMAELEALGIPVIDLVRCDFYPLKDAIFATDATVASVIEKTDIGGPCMVRSAAKGLRIVVCRKEDMEAVLQELEEKGDVNPILRQQLRARAEYEVARYVLDSARFHGGGQFEGMIGERIATIPKGENGSQSPAACYETDSSDPFAPSKFLHVNEGQDLSFINRTDLDRLLQTLPHIDVAWKLAGWDVPFITVIVKHGNACGAGVGKTELESVARAAMGDALSAFGGVVMTNFIITAEIANRLVHAGMKFGHVQKFDAVIAPAFDKDVDEFLERKGGRCRLVANPALGSDCAILDSTKRFRPIRAGFLTQPNYTFVVDLLKVEMANSPCKLTRRMMEDILLAWAICCTSNSNTITIVKNLRLLANAVGQQARVWAAKLAVLRARDAGHSRQLKGSAACSDSFMPFPDALIELIKAGVTTLFTTSGSQIGDKKVRAICKRHNIMLLMQPDSEARGFFGH